MHVRGNLNTLYDGPFRDTQPYQVLYNQEVLSILYSKFTMKFDKNCLTSSMSI